MKIMLRTKLCLLFLVIGFASSATIKRVLFIGNSYTSVNDLPNTLLNLSLSMGDTIQVDNSAPGGFTFNQHSNYATTLAKIQSGNWDFVVLQEQSQIPAFSPAQVQTDCYPYAKKLCDSIRAYNPCAEIVFYMTWGRKNGDASNCASYPPICTYLGMQQRLRESYLEMSDSNHATCAPVGVVWKNYRTAYPLVELYNPDESHPSIQGTYLAACTFYTTIFGKSCVGAQYAPAGVSTSDLFTIQTVASETILDSLENWQHAGTLPQAAFASNIAGANASFTNFSLRYNNSTWDFGDGSAPSTQTSPQHTYTAVGNYVVSLTAGWDTCRSNTVTDTIQITNIATTLNPLTKEVGNVFSNGRNLTYDGFDSLCSLEIFANNGQTIITEQMKSGKQTIQLNVNTGVYYYIVRGSNGQILKRGKLIQ